MLLTEQIAKQFRDVYFGGNWTASNLKEHLADINWLQATTKLYSFNTIAALVFHINYYVAGVTRVMQGQPIDASDKFSFALPPIESAKDWEELLNKTWTDAEKFAVLIEEMPEPVLWETFLDNRYGNYYRNIHGVLEHVHYHLGQIVWMKKLLLLAEPPVLTNP